MRKKGGVSVELIDVSNKVSRYLLREFPEGEYRYWTVPDVISSYFQDTLTSLSEWRSIASVDTQRSSVEEKEGFGGTN